MKFGSVCSGIEAASAAWHPLGWEAQFFSEIEPFPCAVLAHHYPSVPNLGDMTKFKEWPDYDIDVLVGGTPCQSFSVAGLRKGLDDPRGNLMLTYLAIADKYRPRWLVWENVPGVLSSNGGRDFGTLLGGLGQLGYGFAYRVLDAQYFGVAQRRRRVFVVGYLGDWRRAAAVLFERDSLQGNPAPSRKKGKDTAAGTLRSTDGGIDIDHAAAGHLVAGTLQASGKAAGSATTQDAESGLLIPVRALGMDLGVAHSLRGEGFDASEDGTGRGTPLVPVAFDTTQITSATNRSNPGPGDPCHPLAAGAHAPAIAFSCKDYGNDAQVDVTPTLRSMSAHHSHSNGGGQMAVAIQAGALRENPASGPNGVGVQAGIAYTLEARAEVQATMTPTMQVRRLTPRECERLQGFKDDYTLVPHRGKPAADGPRYKALGNSMAVPVMHWIGKRIQAVDGIEVLQVAA